MARVGERRHRVALPTGHHLVGHLPATDPLGGADDVEHAAAGAGADVDGGAGATAGQVVQRGQVGCGQVVHMDVVADARAVRCGVVVAEHVQRAGMAECRLHHHRHEVDGERPVLADEGIGTGPGCIEVAQADGPQAVRAVEPAEHALRHGLGLGVHALGVDRGVLGDGDGRRGAVDGARTGEDHLAHTVVGQCLEQHGRVADIVGPVLGRVLHGLSDALVGGEVHGLGDPVLLAQPGHQRGIGHIAHHQGRVQHGGAMAQFQRVQHHHSPPCLAQCPHRVRADVPGSTRHQYRHRSTSARECRHLAPQGIRQMCRLQWRSGRKRSATVGVHP